MLQDQETLRLVFGLKLKALRQKQAYSLKSLSEKTGLSSSYLNEIEKGKKYPKSDKILLLSKALETNFDELVSLKLEDDYSSFSSLFDSTGVQSIPFEHFGISPSAVLSLFGSDPKRSGRLFKSLMELVRRHNISIEDFFTATLKAHIDENNYYFKDIEKRANTFRTSKLRSTKKLSLDYLKNYLETSYGYQIEILNFGKINPHLDFVSYRFKKEKQKYFFQLNEKLSEKDMTYLLAKEVGYREFHIDIRPLHGKDKEYESLDKQLNELKAYYFALSLLGPEETILSESEKFFKWKKWDNDRFQKFVERFPLPPKQLFHRFAQVWPKHHRLRKLYVLQFSKNLDSGLFKVDEELHLSNLVLVKGVDREDHFCRRWASIRALNSINSRNKVAAIGQLSSLWQTPTKFVNFSYAVADPLDKNAARCYTLGLQLNETTQNKLEFLEDAALDTRTVSETCEKCSITDCRQRAHRSLIIPDEALQF